MKTEHRITIRLSVAEHRQLVELSAELNLTQSEAIRACLATRYRYEDLFAEIQAIRADLEQMRAACQRVATAEADRILSWLNDHVDA